MKKYKYEFYYIQYFAELSNACDRFNQCYAEAQQEMHFHTQLASYIVKMVQGINDYVMIRKLQRDDFIKQLYESETAKSTGELDKEDEKTQIGRAHV